MKFNDIFFSKKHSFSVGIEENSNGYYISIPVSNSKIDYEEYYKISKELYTRYQDNLEDLHNFVNECRNRQHDEDLFLKPGRDRGVPR